MNTKFLMTLAATTLAGAFAAAPLQAQTAATAPTCKDGTTSTVIGKGACSHHGGVNKAAAGPAAAAAPMAAAPAAAAPAAAPAAKAAPAKAAAPAAAAPAAACGAAPAGATAKCKDGTYSMSKHHSGSCSRHGGVDTFLDASK